MRGWLDMLTALANSWMLTTKFEWETGGVGIQKVSLSSRPA